MTNKKRITKKMIHECVLNAINDEIKPIDQFDPRPEKFFEIKAIVDEIYKWLNDYRYNSVISPDELQVFINIVLLKAQKYANKYHIARISNTSIAYALFNISTHD